MLADDGGHDAYCESVGAHSARFEPPDLIFVTYVGDVNESDVHALNAISNRIGIGKRWLVSIVDMSRVGSVSAKARRAWMHSSPLMRGAVFLGVGRKLQIGLSVLVMAFNLLNRHDGVQIAFVDTEEKARAWILERRKVLEAE
jgi:hypothetical protein